MPVDLPAALRAALCTDQISESELRRPAFDLPVRSSTTRLAVAAAVVTVLALVGVLAIFVPHHHPGEDVGDGRLGELAGHRWSVTRIRDRTGALAVPSRWHIAIGYTRDGYVVGNDGANSQQGRYSAMGGGYVVHDAAGSAVGGTGAITPATRVAAAVDSTFSSDAGRPFVRVAAELHGSTLILRSGPFSLTLGRSGTQPDLAAGESSPTPSRTN